MNIILLLSLNSISSPLPPPSTNCRGFRSPPAPLPLLFAPPNSSPLFYPRGRRGSTTSGHCWSSPGRGGGGGRSPVNAASLLASAGISIHLTLFSVLKKQRCTSPVYLVRRIALARAVAGSAEAELPATGFSLDRLRPSVSWILAAARVSEEEILRRCGLDALIVLRLFKFGRSKDENSRLKATDFGLSDFVKPDERLDDIVGSAYYAAPEVLHRSYGAKADVWGISVIAYILLCGSRPFWARTASGIFR